MLLADLPARRNSSAIAPYFQEIGEATLLSPDDERELAIRIQQGDVEAREQMVRANLRLVVALARRHGGRGMCLADLIQEGNLGLVHAVERFDPEQNTRFSTYAKYWIQQALNKALKSTATPVHVPTYANGLIVAWRKTVNQLRDELDRAPTDEEVAGRLQLSRRQLAIVQKARRIYSTDSHAGFQDKSDCITETLVDSRSPAPDACMSADEELQQVIKLMDRLPEREAKVLRLRYGLSGKSPLTLLEIGQQLNLTRERVRQIEKESLARLRDYMEV